MYASIGRHLAPGLRISREEGGYVALRDPDLNVYLQLSLVEACQLRDELSRLLPVPAESAEAAAEPQAVSP